MVRLKAVTAALDDTLYVLGFNSTMVRLKANVYNTTAVIVNGFNSTMVRLKANVYNTTAVIVNGFNSTMVRLKAPLPCNLHHPKSRAIFISEAALIADVD